MSGDVQVDQEMLAVPTASEEDSSECDHNKHNSSRSSNSDVNVDEKDKDDDGSNNDDNNNSSSNNQSNNDDDDLTSSSNDDGDDNECIDNDPKTAKKKTGDWLKGCSTLLTLADVVHCVPEPVAVIGCQQLVCSDRLVVSQR